MLAGYEAVRFKKAQTALTGGSWTSLEQLEVLLHEGQDVGKAQKAVDRSSAMAKGAIVTRSVTGACLLQMCACVRHRLLDVLGVCWCSCSFVAFVSLQQLGSHARLTLLSKKWTFVLKASNTKCKVNNKVNNIHIT